MRAVIDAGQHHDRLGGIEPEGEGEQDADAGEWPDARQHADQRADQTADEGVKQHIRPQRDRETKKQAVEDFHRSEPEQAALKRGLERDTEQPIGEQGQRHGIGGGFEDIFALDHGQQREQQ